MRRKIVFGYEVDEPDPEPTLLEKIKMHNPTVKKTFGQPPTRFNLTAAVGRRRR